MGGIGAVYPEQRAVSWKKKFRPAHFSTRCSSAISLDNPHLLADTNTDSFLFGGKLREEWH